MDMSFIPKINAVLNIQAFSHSMTMKVDTNNTQLQNKIRKNNCSSNFPFRNVQESLAAKERASNRTNLASCGRGRFSSGMPSLEPSLSRFSLAMAAPVLELYAEQARLTAKLVSISHSSPKDTTLNRTSTRASPQNTKSTPKCELLFQHLSMKLLRNLSPSSNHPNYSLTNL
jgi:hypothetical protein